MRPKKRVVIEGFPPMTLRASRVIQELQITSLQQLAETHEGKLRGAKGCGEKTYRELRSLTRKP